VESALETARDKLEERGGMANGEQKWLVETDWLASHLDAPDLIILDGTMPVLDGFSAARKIRELLAKIPKPQTIKRI